MLQEIIDKKQNQEHNTKTKQIQQSDRTIEKNKTEIPELRNTKNEMKNGPDLTYNKCSRELKQKDVNLYSSCKEQRWLLEEGGH